MDLQQIALLVHLIGFAFGLGGATVSDVTFFKALRKRKLSTEAYSFLDMLSKIIWTGLIFAIISGLTMFALTYMEQGRIPMLSSPKWQMKLTLVGIVLINGLYFRYSIFPSLKNIVGQSMNISNISPILTKLALSGTISILSWYSILVVTLLPRTFRPHYLYFLGAYLVLLIIGIIFSRAVIARSVNK